MNAPLTDGERWTRRALADLRAGGLRPRAWARFLTASLVRAGDDLRRRPDLRREAIVWCVAGALVWGGLVALDWSALWGLAWWALVAAMLMTHLGMVEGPRGERRDALGPALALTLARAWVVPALPLVAASPAAVTALALGAATSDALDGPLARIRGETTRLGADADHVVDVALLLALAATAAAAGWLPLWLAVLVGLRYLVPVGLVAVHYFARAAAPPRTRQAGARVGGALVVLGLALAPQSPLAALPVALGLAVGALALGARARRGAARAGAAAPV